MKNITCNQVKQKLDEGNPSFKLVNALEPSKFIKKHIPNSINLFTKDQILEQLNKDDEIVVYCTDYTCNKSIILYYLLEAMGYHNVARFAGGLVEWEGKGLPTTGSVPNKHMGVKYAA